MPALSFNSVNKYYKNVHALNDFSLTVNEGEVFALVGVNGAGKTTAIKSLLGLCKPQNGSIEVFDNKINKSDIGFAPEIPDLPEYFTVEETLKYALNFFKFDALTKKKYIEEAIQLFDLEKIQKIQIRQLSKGNKQRVSLAAATVHNPKLVLFDEPASGLDPIGRNLVKQAIKKLKEQGKTVVFTTHILSDIPEVCDNFAIVHEGRVVFNGNPDAFCSESDKFEQKFIELVSNYKYSENETAKIDSQNAKSKCVEFKQFNVFFRTLQVLHIAKYIFIKSLRNNLILGSLLLSLPLLFAAWQIEQNNPGFQTGFIADVGSFLMLLFGTVVAFILAFDNINNNDKISYFELSRIDLQLYPYGVYSGIILSLLPAIALLAVSLILFMYFTSNSWIDYPIYSGLLIFLQISLFLSVFMLLNLFFKKITSLSLLIIYIIFFDIQAIYLAIEKQTFQLKFVLGILASIFPDFHILSAGYNEPFQLIWLVVYTIMQILTYTYVSGELYAKKDL